MLFNLNLKSFSEVKCQLSNAIITHTSLPMKQCVLIKDKDHSISNTFLKRSNLKLQIILSVTSLDFFMKMKIFAQWMIHLTKFLLLRLIITTKLMDYGVQSVNMDHFLKGRRSRIKNLIQWLGLRDIFLMTDKATLNLIFLQSFLILEFINHMHVYP